MTLPSKLGLVSYKVANWLVRLEVLCVFGCASDGGTSPAAGSSERAPELVKTEGVPALSAPAATSTPEATSLPGEAGSRADAAPTPVADSGAPDAPVVGADAAPAPEASSGASDIPVVISALEVEANPTNLLSVRATWQTRPASVTRLEVNCTSGYDATFTDDVAAVEHSVLVLGLLDGAPCTFTAVAPGREDTGADSGSTREVIELTPGPVPRAFPNLTVTRADASRVQPGWTLFNLSNVGGGLPLKLAMVDDLGRYRWYHDVDTDSSGSYCDVRTVPEGVLVGGASGVEPRIVAWDGTIVWRADILMHHDVRPWSDSELLYLGAVPDGCPSPFWDAWPRSDTIEIWDRTLEMRVWRWTACEHITPPLAELDWDHLNAVVRFPGEEALLISSRTLNSVFKIDIATGDVIWRLGEGGDFTMAILDQFYRQHDPDILPNGNILLFDNGAEGVRETSRAIEIEYTNTPTDRRARVVWTYDPNPVLFTDIWGGARLLPGGNRLITFGMYSDVLLTHIVEVTAQMPAEVVWELTAPLGWSSYRSQRVVDPPLGWVESP